MKTTLGQEIKRLRLEAGFTLRAFAKRITKSPAYQSDIEHGRRMPSEETLREMVAVLAGVGATFDGLKALDGRLDEDVKELVSSAPETSALLRAANQLAEDSDTPLNDILRELKAELEERARKDGKKK